MKDKGSPDHEGGPGGHQFMDDVQVIAPRPLVGIHGRVEMSGFEAPLEERLIGEAQEDMEDP
jgi:hypothetical protein